MHANEAALLERLLALESERKELMRRLDDGKELLDRFKAK